MCHLRFLHRPQSGSPSGHREWRRQNKNKCILAAKKRTPLLGHIDIGRQIEKDDEEVKSAVSSPPSLPVFEQLVRGYQELMGVKYG